VTVDGTEDPDSIDVAGSGTVDITGLAAAVHVIDAEPASDQIRVDGLGGDGAIAGGDLTSAQPLTLLGGDGADVLIQD
jgi:hypothetical protein